MRRLGRAEQEALREAQHVQRAEHDAGDRDARPAPAAALSPGDVLRPGGLEGAQQHQELAGEAAGRRQADRGQRQDHEEHRVHRQQLGQPAVGRELARVAALVDHADHQEQAGGDQAVAHHLDHRALDADEVEARAGRASRSPGG